MSPTREDLFRIRVDEYVAIANAQANQAERGEVCASFMFAAARYCAYLSAGVRPDGKTLATQKKEITDYFLDQFRQMLEGNLEDHIQNFEPYMKPPSG